MLVTVFADFGRFRLEPSNRRNQMACKLDLSAEAFCVPEFAADSAGSSLFGVLSIQR